MKGFEREIGGFATALRRRLTDRRWTVNDLAMLTALSPGYLYRVIRGEQHPSWGVACRIADALGDSLDSLRNGPLFAGEPSPAKPLLDQCTDGSIASDRAGQGGADRGLAPGLLSRSEKIAAGDGLYSADYREWLEQLHKPEPAPEPKKGCTGSTKNRPEAPSRPNGRPKTGRAGG